MTIEGRPAYSQECYKTYSLDQLKVWVQDSLSSEATPKEIASAIMDALREEKDYHAKQVAFIKQVEKHLSDRNVVEASKKDWDDFWEAL
jgi:hypothetical protein